ncbi:MAG: sigma-70 family RNA polymerase sigma factor [Oscillibacter sp.]|nr:sigma-70 family RNA polymerase sigma factor [Oscillibacter sp.]
MRVDYTAMPEKELIGKAARGGRDAFGELVRRYEKKALALSCRLCGNPDDGADAAQDAFLSAWRNLPSFRGDANFSTWLYRLVSNASTDILRRRQRRDARAGASLDDEGARFDAPDPAPAPQEVAERRELRQELQDALQTLSPEHRQVLILREIHQLSYEEIGEALSLDIGTVKSRLHRAREAMRKILLGRGTFSPPERLKGQEKQERRAAT